MGGTEVVKVLHNWLVAWHGEGMDAVELEKELMMVVE